MELDRLPGGERVAAETSLGQVAHGDRAVDRHVGEGKFLTLGEALPALAARLELPPVSSLTGFGLAGFVSVLLIAERAPAAIQIEDAAGPTHQCRPSRNRRKRAATTARIPLRAPQSVFAMVSRTTSTKAEMRSWIMRLSIAGLVLVALRTVVPVGAGGAGPFGSGARCLMPGPGSVVVILAPCGDVALGGVLSSELLGVV